MSKVINKFLLDRVARLWVFSQGILKGEVTLYCWPPVWLVWNQLYDYWQFLFLFAKQTNPNQSNRRSMGQWYFPLQHSLLFLLYPWVIWPPINFFMKLAILWMNTLSPLGLQAEYLKKITNFLWPYLQLSMNFLQSGFCVLMSFFWTSYELLSNFLYASFKLLICFF
jgi:hypothetical protein